MNATINVTELACEIAERELHTAYADNFDGGVQGMYEIKEDGCTGYVEEAQDIFNGLHDKWEDIIMQCEEKTPSCNIAWYKADIESLGFECSDEEAEEVFELAENNHDANVGVNWEVLEEWCEYVGLKRVNDES